MKNLREQAYAANILLPELELTLFAWGNASAADPKKGLFAIKPSGVPYAELSPERMTVLDFDGAVVSGAYAPSSDSPTHLALYRAFPGVGGVVHTHSRWACIWAQAGRDIPALGTTHADYFDGPIPCARPLTPQEVESDYEAATGQAIAEAFQNRNPLTCPAALAAHHGPFAWGGDAAHAAHNARVLEEAAMTAWHTLALNPQAALPDFVLKKHFTRKHGPDAYYGQR